MKKIAVVSLVYFAVGSISVVNAAAGNSTVSIGYAQIHSNELKNLINDSANEISGINDGAVKITYVNSDKYKDPKGFNLKYRYEINDNFGVIGSLTYAADDYGMRANALVTDAGVSENISLNGKVKVKYFSIDVGPTYRFNEYVSAYVMGGIAQSKSKIDANVSSGTTSVSLLSESKSKNKFSYAAGLQFNPIKNIAIDVAYERSSSGDGKINGFNVGVGYVF